MSGGAKPRLPGSRAGLVGVSAPLVRVVDVDPCDLRVRVQRQAEDAQWAELWEARDRAWELWN